MIEIHMTSPFFSYKAARKTPANLAGYLKIARRM